MTSEKGRHDADRRRMTMPTIRRNILGVTPAVALALLPRVA